MITVITTVLVALITAIIGPIVVSWARLKMDKKPKINPMQEAIEFNSLVDEQLQILLEELECDRVWIAQFHNGGNFYPTGKSIQKFSMFYEKVSHDTPPIQHTFQSIPCSLFPQALSQIYKFGELSISEYSEGNEMYGLEAISKSYGTKSFYMFGLYSLDNHLIGVMSIAFNNQHKLTKNEWIFIRQKIGVIGTLLSEYLYKNNIIKK
jgi:hypothetical protein